MIPCTAVRTVEWKIKSEANIQLNWNYSNPNFTDCFFFTGKNVTAVFLSVQSSNSSGRVIIVDIYTTVVKILGESFSDRHMPWNGGWTGWKIIFDKNCFPAGSWCGTIRQSGAFRQWNWLGTIEIFCCCSIEGRSFPGLNCQVRLTVSLLRTWCASCLAIMVGEHCDRCSSQAVVCEMWLYTCSLWTSLSSCCRA